MQRARAQGVVGLPQRLGVLSDHDDVVAHLQTLGHGIPAPPGSSTNHSNRFHVYQPTQLLTLPPVCHVVGGPAASKARVRSCCRSRTSSNPTDRRTVWSLIPHAARPSAPSLRWVVDAGWVTMDFTSPRLLEMSMTSNASKTSKGAAWGARSNVTTDPPPLMRRRARSC